MIAIFSTQEAAQAYCDERSTALGYPIIGKHPRTGAKYIVTAAWDVPVQHPKLPLWRVNVDLSGPHPKAELVGHTPEDWDRYSPIVAADRADPTTAAELARTETDSFAMTLLIDKITPEQAGDAARENPDPVMQIALIQKQEEVYLWLKNRSS